MAAMTTEGSVAIKGVPVDIKPYFPYEEIAEGFNPGEGVNSAILNPFLFKGDPIGEFMYCRNYGMIRLRGKDSLPEKAFTEALMKIKAGTFLRVLWWFNRFDDK